jgi:hypothetical protein
MAVTGCFFATATAFTFESTAVVLLFGVVCTSVTTAFVGSVTPSVFDALSVQLIPKSRTELKINCICFFMIKQGFIDLILTNLAF